MAEFRVILQPEAERNITATYAWIAERSLLGATRWYGAWQKALDQLKAQPNRFPEARESRHFNEVIRDVSFRMRSGRTYRALFTIRGNEVHVLYVRGPGQDWVTP